MSTVRNVLIQGASRGIGFELVRAGLDRGERVLATCRTPSEAHELSALAAQHPQLTVLALDVTDEESIQAAARDIGRQVPRLHRLLNVAGLLHTPSIGPERAVEDIDPDALHTLFAVNAFGPILVAKHFHPLLTHDEPAVLANLSARLGSIADNRLGGWYTYRASKAAQNMFTKTLAVELRRRARNLAVIALHPGTVDTGLSRPGQRNVPPDKLFTTQRAARQLLAVVDGVQARDTGSFLAWDGRPIPW